MTKLGGRWMWLAVFAAIGVILSAIYALWLYRRMIFGVLEKPSLRAMTDMTPREAAIMLPLVILTILFGFYPAPLLDVTSESVTKLVNDYNAALAAAEQARMVAAQ